jgi:c-di-GMP-binding flagellar brake protein YcgR
MADSLCMRFDPQAGVMDNDDSDDSDRRNRGRLSQEALETDLGPVLDLSGGGMRIHTRKSLKQGQELVVTLLESKLRLKARVAWIKKAGMFKQEIGLEFLEITEEISRALTRICTDHRMRRVC